MGREFTILSYWWWGGGIPEWVKNKMKGIDCLAFVALYSWPMIEFKVKVGKWVWKIPPGVRINFLMSNRIRIWLPSRLFILVQRMYLYSSTVVMQLGRIFNNCLQYRSGGGAPKRGKIKTPWNTRNYIYGSLILKLTLKRPMISFLSTEVVDLSFRVFRGLHLVCL